MTAVAGEEWAAGESSRADERVAELYSAEVDRLVALGYLVTGSTEDAEDLAQDVFAEVLRRDRIEPGFLRDPAWPWLRLVLVRMATRRRRRLATELARLVRLYPRTVAEPFSDETFDYVAALGRLPTRMRACVVLFYQEDLAAARVAEILQCSPRTVETQLRTARHRLAKELSQDELTQTSQIGPGRDRS